ncbi:MAG: HipA family kinase [Candidatus Acidiferrum sp.]
MLLRLTATQFVRVMTSGRTNPILCGCSDSAGNPAGEFIVKLLGQPKAGSCGALFESVASRLAQHFDILVPEPAAIEITPEFARIVAGVQPQLGLALQAGVGFNFGSRVIHPMSTWLVGRSIPEAMLADAVKIFAFDALIQNPDRRADNPNLFTQGDGIYIYDHELSFSFLLALAVSPQPWNLEDHNYLQHHVFYSRLKSRDLDFTDFRDRLSSLRETVLTRIKTEVPKEWMHENWERIEAHLNGIRAYAEEFVEQVRRRLA